jgi:protein SCO1
VPIQPVFITVDPARDSAAQISRYLQDFHPSFVGLHGEYKEIKRTCKAYRVYFSTPPNADPNGDYLVDHSIFVYLMDPDGNFVEAFGQAVTKEEVVQKTREAISKYHSRS